MRGSHAVAWGVAWVVAGVGVVACASDSGAKKQQKPPPHLVFTLIDASVQKPSNVAVYFTLDTDEGEPVPNLTADQFRIYEDGKPVSVFEAKQTILNPEASAAHYTLLLIDMSGSVTESGDIPIIQNAARAFAARVEKVQRIAVYAFDGSKEIHRLVGFERGEPLMAGIEKLATFKPKDPSTNLNGGVVEGLRILRRELDESKVPLTFGTLVVFTDGTDRAHRVPRDKASEAVALSGADVFVIGVGAEIDEPELREIGGDRVIVSKDNTQIAAAFDQAATRVEAFSRRYYLLGYCSPSRDGEHDVTVETSVEQPGPDNKPVRRSGELSYHFNARGFEPNCDPEKKPNFSLKRTTPKKQPRPAPGKGTDPAAR